MPRITFGRLVAERTTRVCINSRLGDGLSWPAGAEPRLQISYFLIGVGIDDFPCAPPKGKAGAAGLVLSFLGFFCSRLLRICPLAILDLLSV